MAYCPKCSSRIRKTAKVCKTCGRKLRAEEILPSKPDQNGHHLFCEQHPQKSATALCVKCRKALCSLCVERLNDNPYCSSCFEKEKRKSQEAQTTSGGLVEGTITGLGIMILAIIGIALVVGFTIWFFGGCDPDYNDPDYEPDYDKPPRPWAYIIPESLGQNSYTLLLDDYPSSAL